MAPTFAVRVSADTASLLPALAARNRLPAASTLTTTGSLFCCSERACESGRSTSTPRLSSGAVIMKITSSTSITSMYGTTLISDLSLRRRVRRAEMTDMAFLSYSWIQRPRGAG